VLDEDTPESLGERVLEQEHRIYPLALRLVASGAVRVEGNRVLGAATRASAPLLAPDTD